MEVDRRTGAVVSFFYHRLPDPGGSFEVTKEEAIEKAISITKGGTVQSAVAERWKGLQWTVTVKRDDKVVGELKMKKLTVPDVVRIIIDGKTGEVISQSKT